MRNAGKKNGRYVDLPDVHAKAEYFESAEGLYKLR